MRSEELEMRELDEGGAPVDPDVVVDVAARRSVPGAAVTYLVLWTTTTTGFTFGRLAATPAARFGVTAAAWPTP